MFDIGFWELILIAVVALVVIGPERLPGLARTAGMWIGKARRFLGSVRADIERELKADELRRILDEQAKSNPLEEVIEETKDAFSDIDKAGAVLKSEGKGEERQEDRGPTAGKDKSANG
jgi:sec-independent protein translocase protein TatB